MTSPGRSSSSGNDRTDRFPDPRRRSSPVDGKRWAKMMAQDHKRAINRLSFKVGLTKSTLRSTDRRRDPEDYQPGLIFSGPCHSTNSRLGYIPNDDPNLTATPYGTVYSKYRKFVVVMRHADTFTCLPIYTHNGNGLDGKSWKECEEFISIRDTGDAFPCEAEGRHQMLWAEQYETYAGSFISGRSCIKITEWSTNRYDDWTTIEGELKPESLVILQALLANVVSDSVRGKIQEEVQWMEEEASDYVRGKIQEEVTWVEDLEQESSNEPSQSVLRAAESEAILVGFDVCP